MSATKNMRVLQLVMMVANVMSFPCFSKVCPFGLGHHAGTDANLALTTSSILKKTSLSYKNFDDAISVDEAVVDAAAARAIAPELAPAKARPSSRVAARHSAVQRVRTVEDYHELVKGEEDKLSVVRFHAPWCKVCQQTNVAYDRLASKLRSNSQVNFYSVSLDGKDETVELKDLFDIQGVPMGLLYHPRVGMMGKFKMGRAGLVDFKKKLGRYVEGACDLEGLLDGLVTEEDKAGVGYGV